MSIYTELKEANCKILNHQSDLYVKVTNISTKIIQKYKTKITISTFNSQIDKTLWYDIPFMYDPFWEKIKTKKGEKNDCTINHEKRKRLIH